MRKAKQQHRRLATHSKRGSDAVGLLPTYLADARSVDKFCPQNCPEGALQLGVAENQMLEDLLVPALTKFSQSSEFCADWIYYQPTHGRPGLRTAMASYLERTLKITKRTLDPEGIVVGAGCNAVLENLCMCLAEPGDAVLIPTPYYAAFEFDLVARAGLSIVPVNTFSPSNVPPVGSNEAIPVEAYYPRRSVLDSAYHRSLENGVQPRVLLLSHPNNPLGICYPPSVIKECIDWCREHKVHLISDEIYAGSVYRNPDVFQSALEVAPGESLGDYVHLVYALSKDFALSGLRVGASYSENKHIRLANQKLNDLCQISSQTQHLVETMLTETDDDGNLWTDSFLQENQARIRNRCDQLLACLDECGIPYLPADSGLFVWMDFSQFLPALDPASIQQDGEEAPDNMDERERALYRELMTSFGCLFTPGRSMRHERPGFFRCVFTAASDEEFALSLVRLKEFVEAKSCNDGN